jgi:hypothetical protein
MVCLSSGWWLKRPKEEGAEIPAMERLVGPVAYRGRTQMIQRKTGTISKQSRVSPKRGIMHSNLTKRGIPHNTIRSERSKPTSQRPRSRKPGDDFGVY